MLQETLIAGDSLDFITSPTLYPASAGWTLTYVLTPQAAGGTSITFTATASGDDYLIEVSAATTAAWTAGAYSWASAVSKAGERFTVDDGSITIRPDPFTATSLDNRSHARKMLDAIEAALESRATASQLDLLELTIYSRSSKRDPSVLMKARSQYIAEVARENAALGIRPGNGRVFVRF
jgi:hypothetical protein